MKSDTLWGQISDRFGFSGSVYNQIVQTILCALAFLMPLWYLPATAGPLEFNKQLLLVIGVSVALIVWLLGAVVSGKILIRTSPLDLGVLAVLASTALASVFSVVWSRSVFGIS